MSEGMIKDDEKHSYMATQYIDLNVLIVAFFDFALPPQLLDGYKYFKTFFSLSNLRNDIEK